MQIERITHDLVVMGGKPCICGLRVTVQDTLLENMGHVFTALRQYDAERQYFEEAVQLFGKVRSKYGV